MSSLQLQDKLNQHLSFLAQDENNLNLLIEICDLHFELDDLESAQKYLDKANAINHEACLAYQGLLYLNRGLFTEAKISLQEALNTTDTPALRYNLGFTHFITNDLEKAWEILSPILDGEHYPLAEILMARILHKQGSLEESVSLVEHVLELNPNDVEALGFLSLLYFDLNEEDLAKEISTKTLEHEPDNYDAKLVNIMLRLMTQETTAEEIEALLEHNHHDSRLWFALGNTYMSQGNLEAAENTLNKAIEIYPDFYDCHIALAWCQLLNNHLSEAHETYQNAVALADYLADAWGGLAIIYALNADYPKAEQLINKAYELNPECFLTEIAQTIYLNHTNPKKAQQHLFTTLNNHEVPVSEKLAVIISEMQKQLH